MKTERIYIRCTKDQKKQIEKDAEKLNLSMSSYAIMVLLGPKK